MKCRTITTKVKIIKDLLKSSRGTFPDGEPAQECDPALAAERPDLYLIDSEDLTEAAGGNYHAVKRLQWSWINRGLPYLRKPFEA